MADPVLTTIGAALAANGLLYLWFRSRRTTEPTQPAQVEVLPACLPDGSRPLPLDGSEVFFLLPEPSHENPVYQVVVTGTIVLQRREWPHEELERFDAVYRVNESGRFEDSHYRLLVNGQPCFKWDLEWVEEDRCLHRYVFNVGRLKRRIGIAFTPPGYRNSSVSTGSLIVSVTVLPPGALTADQRLEAERRQRRAAQEAAAAKREAIAAADHFGRIVQALTVRAATDRNWRDPEFQQKFARVHCEDLIKRQAEIRAEAAHFLEQTHLVAYLRQHNPTVVATLLGRLEALLLAENLALDKAIAAAEAPERVAPAAPPKKRLTAEEVRALKIHRQQIQDQDRVALKIDKIETRLMIRERLEKMPLDADEREMLEQELISEIEEGDTTDGNTRTI